MRFSFSLFFTSRRPYLIFFSIPEYKNGMNSSVLASVCTSISTDLLPIQPGPCVFAFLLLKRARHHSATFALEVLVLQRLELSCPSCVCVDFSRAVSNSICFCGKRKEAEMINQTRITWPEILSQSFCAFITWPTARSSACPLFGCAILSMRECGS